MNLPALTTAMVSGALLAMSSQPPGGLGQSAPAGAPRIVLLEPEQDLGTISDDRRVSVCFGFRNDGTDNLTVRIAQRFRQESFTVAPGSEGTIPYSLDPHRKVGPHRYHFTVTTNDPTAPEVYWGFRFVVRPEIVIDPPMATFGTIPSGQPAIRLVRVVGPPVMAATCVSTTKGRLVTGRVIETWPIVRDGALNTESVLEFTVNAGAPPGVLQALATVRTTDPKHPLLDIQVSAEVQPLGIPAGPRSTLNVLPVSPPSGVARPSKP